MKQYFRNSLNLAQSLHSGHCGGGYDEAAHITAGILSGISAIHWPGHQIDKKRFVELLVRFGPASVKKVSVPLLYQDDSLTQAQLRVLEGTVPALKITGRIITGSEDMDEAALIAKAQKEGTSFALKILRKYSYGHLLDREIRCGFAHEFRIGTNAATFRQTQFCSGISYVNFDRHRRIFFPFPEMKTIVGDIITNAPFTGQVCLAKWWIDG